MATRGRPSIDKQAEASPQPAEGMPTCPNYLDGVAKKKWREIIKVLGNSGLLTKADADAIAVYCTWFARWRDAETKLAKSGAVISGPSGFYQNPYLAIASRAVSEMRKLGKVLGLDPAARQHLKIKARAGRKPVATRDRMGDTIGR